MRSEPRPTFFSSKPYPWQRCSSGGIDLVIKRFGRFSPNGGVKSMAVFGWMSLLMVMLYSLHLTLTHGSNPDMAKIDEVKARLDWLKDQFKVLVAILVADVAGISKLYLDARHGLLFYLGLVLLVVLAVAMIIVSRKIEIHLVELEDI